MIDDFQEFEIPIPASADGYTGRECPECDEYFKIMLGTGIKDIEGCFCPYCGHHEHYSFFHTASQIDYATSVAFESISSDIESDLNRMAEDFNRQFQRDQGLFSLSLEIDSTPPTIHFPADFRLETHVECSNCTLKYAVYGVYAYCPDCGRHNAVQMLENNLETSGKLLDLADGQIDANDTLVGKLISKSLTDVVASFDGFGRAICETYASKSSNPTKAESIRFQNLIGARTSIGKYFGFDISTGLTQAEWEMANRCFQKRHVLEHKSGVVDQEYKQKANDSRAVVGRKVNLSKSEVRRLIDVIRNLGKHIFSEMEKLL